jgi:hypothetical protein
MRQGYRREAVGVLVGAILLGTFALLDLVSEIKLDRNGVVVPGEVISVGRERKDLRIKVEFTTRDGKAVRAVLSKNDWGGGPPDRGDDVRIRYDPDDPGGTATKSSRGFYFRYIWSFMLGCWAVGLAYVSLWLFRKRRRPVRGPVAVPAEFRQLRNEDATETWPGSRKNP